MEIKLCTRCQIRSEMEFLREIAHSTNRSVEQITRNALYGSYSSIGQESKKYTQQRLEQEQGKLEKSETQLGRYEEELSYEVIDDILGGMEIDGLMEQMVGDQKRKQLEEEIRAIKWKSSDISQQDVRQALEEYERQGYIEVQKGKIRITSKGARRLASSALERILRSLGRKDVGSHSIEQTGFGSEISTHSRRWEVGDDYSLVNVERTALNALERKGKLELEPEDFEVHEQIHQARLCAGLIIDESGSMRSDRKLGAAIETALALSELIRREPKDSLRVFIFSEIVKEIPPLSIVNEVLSGGYTDIRAALSAFRKATRGETGDIQAYLITDTDPNTEDGRHVGFDKAAAGVMEEALHYRQQGIGLNIIMLDQSPHLKQLTSALARQNLGRAFFTSPLRLGGALVDDYLRAKRETA